MKVLGLVKHLYVSYVQVCKNKFEKKRINLWFPSMCHIALGAGTEYCLRLSVRLATARTSVPTGSTLLKESRTLVTTTEQ